MHAENRLEGGTLVVRIPMRLGRQRGRKRILAPDGSELTPPTMPQPDGVLVKALARAWRWQRLLDRGVHGSVTEIAAAESISKSYVSRILRLALLAPDIVEAILGGWADQRVMLERLERPLPMAWGSSVVCSTSLLSRMPSAMGNGFQSAMPSRRCDANGRACFSACARLCDWSTGPCS